LTATYNFHGHTVFVNYVCEEGIFTESFSIQSEKSRNIFYAKFVRLHCEKPSRYYMHMKYSTTIEKMLKDSTLKTPYLLLVNGKKIKRKTFYK
jgi:hypothetical protein